MRSSLDSSSRLTDALEPLSPFPLPAAPLLAWVPLTHCPASCNPFSLPHSNRYHGQCESVWAFNLNLKFLEGKELALYWCPSPSWYLVYVVGTQQMLSEWIGKCTCCFQCFSPGRYRILAMRTRKKRLKMRKLDTAGKAQANTLGKVRKGMGCRKHPVKFSQAKMNW